MEICFAIFVNVLELDDSGQPVNEKYAEKRAATWIYQYCTPLVLCLTILPPGLPPNGTERWMAVEGKRAGQRGYSRDLAPDWNCPPSTRQRHTGSDLGFFFRAELRTFSLHRKRSSDRQTKNPPDLRSPLTESNRRPSPYHPHFPGFTARQALPAGRQQAPIWLLPRPAASAIASDHRACSRAVVGTGPCQACAAPARAWSAIQAWPLGLHAGQSRPLRRSKDGQTIFPILPAQDPKTTLNGRFPIARKI